MFRQKGENSTLRQTSNHKINLPLNPRLPPSTIISCILPSWSFYFCLLYSQSLLSESVLPSLPIHYLVLHLLSPPSSFSIIASFLSHPSFRPLSTLPIFDSRHSLLSPMSFLIPCPSCIPDPSLLTQPIFIPCPPLWSLWWYLVVGVPVLLWELMSWLISPPHTHARTQLGRRKFPSLM